MFYAILLRKIMSF